jgi:hypothetical protein
VRRFRLKHFFASKRNEAKLDSFRFVFACSSENKEPIFSLVFASFRFKFFVSLRSEKKKKRFFRFVSLPLNFFSHLFRLKFFVSCGLFSIYEMLLINRLSKPEEHNFGGTVFNLILNTDK